MKKNHPLLNPESTHYQMVDGVEAIERLEDMFSVDELMVWSKITAMKYRLRISNKDATDKEIVKIKGYEAYYKYLDDSGQGSVPSKELEGQLSDDMVNNTRYLTDIFNKPLSKCKLKNTEISKELKDILEFFKRAESKIKAVDVHEDLYNICETHKFGCMCHNCFNLNKIDLTLQDRKRRFQADKAEERLKVNAKLEALASGEITFVEFSEWMVKEHPNQTFMSFDVSA